MTHVACGGHAGTRLRSDCSTDKRRTGQAKQAVDPATAALDKAYGEASRTMTGQPVLDKAAVEKAFEALKTYDLGQDRNLLKPIDDAVVATHGDAAARKDLETVWRRVLADGTRARPRIMSAAS